MEQLAAQLTDKRDRLRSRLSLEITGAAKELDPVGPQAFSASSELICYAFSFSTFSIVALNF